MGEGKKEGRRGGGRRRGGGEKEVEKGGGRRRKEEEKRRGGGGERRWKEKVYLQILVLGYNLYCNHSLVPRPLSDFISQLWRKIREWPGNEATDSSTLTSVLAVGNSPPHPQQDSVVIDYSILTFLRLNQLASCS